MIALIKELNRTSKKAPKKVRSITIYNIVNFIFTLVATLAIMVISLIMAEQFTSEIQVLMIFLPLIFVAINYYVLQVNRNFIHGSLKSYWILLLFLILQCVAFRFGDYSFELNLGGIPFSFSLTLGGIYFKVNFAAIIFTGYLVGVKDEYATYVQEMDANRRQTKSF